MAACGRVGAVSRRAGLWFLGLLGARDCEAVASPYPDSGDVLTGSVELDEADFGPEGKVTLLPLVPWCIWAP